MRPNRNRTTAEYFRGKVERLNQAFLELKRTENAVLKTVRSGNFLRKFNKFLETLDDEINNQSAIGISIFSNLATSELKDFFFECADKQFRIDGSLSSTPRFRNVIAGDLALKSFHICRCRNAALDKDFFSRTINFEQDLRKEHQGGYDPLLVYSNILGMLVEKNNPEMIRAVAAHLKESSVDKPTLLQELIKPPFLNSVTTAGEEVKNSFLEIFDSNLSINYERPENEKFENISLLHLAFLKPEMSGLVKNLFKKQKDHLLAVDSSGDNFLHLALSDREQNPEFLEQVLSYFNQNDDLTIEESQSRKNQLTSLLEQKNNYGYTPIQNVASDQDLFGAFLEALNPKQTFEEAGNIKNSSLLHLVAKRSNLLDLADKALEKQKDNLLEVNSLGDNFLHRALEWGNDEFFKKAVSYFYQENLSEEEKVSRKQTIETLFKQKHLLRSLVLKDRYDLLQYMFEKGFAIDWSENLLMVAQNSRMADLLCKNSADTDLKAAAMREALQSIDQYEIVEALINNGVIVSNDPGENKVMSILNDASLLHNNGTMRHLLQEYLPDQKISEDELQRFSQVSQSAMVSGLACSTREFGTSHVLFETKVRSAIKRANLEQYTQDLMSDLADYISKRGGLKVSNGHKFTVIYSGIKRHAAYFIIESDQNDMPLRISYCDGNLPIEKESGFGEVIFDLDQEKLAHLSCNKSQNLVNLLQGRYLEEISDLYETNQFNTKLFEDVFSRFVKCDSDGKPLVVGMEIPTKPQNRGNCVFKGFNITLRALMQKVDPDLKFLRDEEGKNYGAGYEVFKSYKNGLIESSVTDILEAAKEDNRSKLFYDTAIRSLKNSVFLWAAKKGKIELVEKIADILEREKIDLSEITDEDDQNVLSYASFQQAKENTRLMEFCRHRNLKPNSQNCYRSLCDNMLKAINDGNSEFARYLLQKFPTEDLQEQDVNIDSGHDIFFRAAFRKDFEIAKEMIDKWPGVKFLEKNNLTLLHILCENFVPEKMDLLIEAGIREVKDVTNNSPMHYAAYYGGEEMVRYLLNKGFICDKKNDDGTTAIDFAKENINLSPDLIKRMEEVSESQIIIEVPSVSTSSTEFAKTIFPSVISNVLGS